MLINGKVINSVVLNGAGIKSIAQSLTTTVSTSVASAVRAVGKLIQTVASVSTASITTIKVKLLILTTTALVSTASIIKAVKHSITTNASISTVSIVKALTHLFSISSTSTITLLRILSYLRTVTTTAVTSTSTFLKAVGKLVTTTALTNTATISRKFAYVRMLTTTLSASTVSKILVLGKLINLTSSSTSTITRAISKRIITALEVTVTLLSKIASHLYSLVITSTITPVLTKQVQKLMTAFISGAINFGNINAAAINQATAGILVIGSYVTLATIKIGGIILSASTTSTASLIKQTNKLLTYLSTIVKVLTKSIRTTITYLSNSNSAVFKQIKTILSLGSSISSLLSKVISKPLALIVEHYTVILIEIANHLVLLATSITSTGSIVKAIAKQMWVQTSSALNGAGINFGAINQAATSTVIGVISVASLAINSAYKQTLLAASTSVSLVNKLCNKVVTTAIETTITIITELVAHVQLLTVSVTSVGNIIKAISKNFIVLTYSAINGNSINFSAINQGIANTYNTIVSTVTLVYSLFYYRTFTTTNTTVAFVIKQTNKYIKAISTSFSTVVSIHVYLVNLIINSISTVSQTKRIAKLIQSFIGGSLNSFAINATAINQAIATGVLAVYETVSITITNSRILMMSSTAVISLSRFTLKNFTTLVSTAVNNLIKQVNKLIPAFLTNSFINAINGFALNAGSINGIISNSTLKVASYASIRIAYVKQLFVTTLITVGLQSLISKLLFNVTTVLTILRTTLNKVLSTNVITFITAGINFASGAGASFTYTIYVPLKRRLLNLLRIREVYYNHNDNVNRED